MTFDELLETVPVPIGLIIEEIVHTSGDAYVMKQDHWPALKRAAELIHERDVALHNQQREHKAHMEYIMQQANQTWP